MIKHVAHCADRRRRSGAQTSGTEVKRSRTGRRSVRAQRRNLREGYYYPRVSPFSQNASTPVKSTKKWEPKNSLFSFWSPIFSLLNY